MQCLKWRICVATATATAMVMAPKSKYILLKQRRDLHYFSGLLILLLVGLSLFYNLCEFVSDKLYWLDTDCSRTLNDMNDLPHWYKVNSICRRSTYHLHLRIQLSHSYVIDCIVLKTQLLHYVITRVNCLHNLTTGTHQVWHHFLFWFGPWPLSMMSFDFPFSTVNTIRCTWAGCPKLIQLQFINKLLATCPLFIFSITMRLIALIWQYIIDIVLSWELELCKLFVEFDKKGSPCYVIDCLVLKTHLLHYVITGVM